MTSRRLLLTPFYFSRCALPMYLKWQLPVWYILLRKSLAMPGDSRIDSRLRRCLGGITFTEFTFDSRVAANFLTKWQKHIGDKTLQFATYGRFMQTTKRCKLQRIVVPCKRPNAAKQVASICRKRQYYAKVAYHHLQREVGAPIP